MSSFELNLEPGLLSEHQLKTLIRNKGISVDESLNKQDLIQLYLKHIQPQPQRANKSKQKTSNSLPVSPTTSVICLKTQNILLGDSMASRQKRFSDDNSIRIVNNNQTTKMDVDLPAHTTLNSSNSASSKLDCIKTETSQKQKIVLKRTHLVTSNAESSGDEIKKSKLELK